MAKADRMAQRRREERKALGLNLRQWFEHVRAERRLKVAFKPKQRPARFIPQEIDHA